MGRWRRTSGASRRRETPTSFQDGPLVLKRVVLIAVAVVLFLGISGLLAGFLSTENVERDDDLALVQAEARGDVAGMLDALSGCRASRSCVAAVKRDASDPHVLRAGS